MPNNLTFKVSNPPQIHKPNGYSHVVEVTAGKMVYISGQVALDVSGNIVGEGDYRAQIQQGVSQPEGGAGIHRRQLS